MAVDRGKVLLRIAGTLHMKTEGYDAKVQYQ
jgi:hypothetical protein